MNWFLVAQLSFFGLAMGLATVSIIPSNIEPLFWLGIFLMCAYIIARRCASRFFLHGLSVSVLNSIWITAAHLLFFEHYIAYHHSEAAFLNSYTSYGTPRLMMALTGPVIGILSGVVLGCFAVIASKFVKRQEAK